MPESSLDAGMVTWVQSVLTRPSTFNINARDLALYNVMEDVRVPASGSCLDGGVSEASPSRLSSRQNDSSILHAGYTFKSGRIGPPTANLVDLQPEVLSCRYSFGSGSASLASERSASTIRPIAPCTCC
jgi:hypothetical protein